MTMNYIRLLSISVTLVMLYGCARYDWRKESATEHDLKADTHECEHDVRQSGYFGGVIAMQRHVDRCMIAKGWKKVKVE
jgi:hypothetical protein